MYLKSLHIKGFKSFADPATLELEGGITVVVGPNGSGKSNVVDAIAWVLGAQAPSAVRSQKMDDVIFAGTQSKAALGRAEVSLTIDNSNGVLPIEFTEVKITRTLFRTGESEYAINGTSCRLLDIQELLSDSGVGRQQHIIVSQGQIDAVLNARPEERRAIIEEAAGVLKFRKRKERAERRLKATEDNLNRLGDLVREVRRQLRPLEKQADAARRHGDLVAELDDLKLHLAGQEYSVLRAELDSSERNRAAYDKSSADLTETVARLDHEIRNHEQELLALGGSDIADVLSRASSLRERIRGQANVIEERRQRLATELQSAVDDGVVASLEAEAARISEDLVSAKTQTADLAPAHAELDAEASGIAQDVEAFEARWGDGIGPAPLQAGEVRTQVAGLTSAAARDTQACASLGSRIDNIKSKIAVMGEEQTAATQALAEAEPLVETLKHDIIEATQAQVDASQALENASDSRRKVDDELSRWQARADALGQALDDAHTLAGVDALAETDGVLGTLLDLVEIDQGWESAVEAAFGDALSAVVVEGVAQGRGALEALASADQTGGVLTLLDGVVGTVTPDFGTPIRQKVTAIREDLNPLLDALLARAVAIDGDWRAAIDLAVSNPGLVVVTKQGDRFAPTGWRIGKPGAGATRAALDEASARALDAGAAALVAAEEATAAQEHLVSAQSSLGQLTTTQSATESLIDSSNAILSRTRAGLAEMDREVAELGAQHSEIDARRQSEEAELAVLAAKLPELEELENDHNRVVQAMAEGRAGLGARQQDLNSRRTELDVKAAGIVERSEFLEARGAEIEARLARLTSERTEARGRRERIESKVGVVESLRIRLTTNLERADRWLSLLKSEQDVQSSAVRTVSDSLTALRRDREARATEFGEIKDRRTRLELTDAENKVRLETLVEMIQRELHSDPVTAAQAPRPEVPEGTTVDSRAAELEQELRIMGPINPLALDEFTELSERHEFLTGQVDDVKATRRELQKLIRDIDEEIVRVFAEAYEDVAKNFTALFSTLFPGGKGELKLTNEEEPLNCGIEIEAKPSGKNVKKLSLLSGGERSLTALGFLFAVFRSRPSPFYVMDEVEAALDDMNLHRFLQLVKEFRNEAQLIIVSHQKRTMEAADVLYGISMKPGGSSKVVSEKVEKKLAETIDLRDSTAAIA